MSNCWPVKSWAGFLMLNHRAEVPNWDGPLAQNAMAVEKHTGDWNHLPSTMPFALTLLARQIFATCSYDAPKFWFAIAFLFAEVKIMLLIPIPSLYIKLFFPLQISFCSSDVVWGRSFVIPNIPKQTQPKSGKQVV